MFRKIFISFTVTVLMAVSAFAGDEKSGFFGELSVGAGYMSGTPGGDEYSSKNEKIENLSDKMEKDSKSIPYIDFNVGYYIDESKTDIILGLEKNGLMLEVFQETDFAMVDVGFFYDYGKVWENPYTAPLKGAGTEYKRTSTDRKIYGFSVGASNIAGRGTYADFTFGQIDLSSDKVVYKELKRGGKFYTIDLGYMFPISKTQSVSPVLSYTKNDLDGESSSSNEYKLGFSHHLDYGRFTFDTDLSIVMEDYNKKHPVFSKERKDNKFSVSGTIGYLLPYWYENIYVFTTAAYTQRESNINFYDSNGLMLLVGTGLYF